MPSTSLVPIAITFRKPGIHPPVFLAGTFTTPEWALEEMKAVVAEGGDRVFESQVAIEIGREYQFKFKVGTGDSWTVDESKPIVTDSLGSRRNVLKITPELALGAQRPRPINVTKLNTQPTQQGSYALSGQYAADSKTAVAKVKDEQERRSSTPIEQVAATAAEVADTAEKLDAEESSPPQASVSGGESEIEEDLKTPLFAHECLGAYEFVDDGLDHHTFAEIKQRRGVGSKSSDYGEDETDTNDPTIERFPSDKSSIFGILRKMQSSMSEDQVALDDQGSSARLDSRRASIDSDDSSLSAGSLSPISTRRRENRLSTSSARNRSVVSLGAIAEEPKVGGGGVAGGTPK